MISPVGTMTAAVKVSDGLPAGMLFAPLSFPDSPVNELFPAVLDAQSKTPAMGHCAVRLERRYLHD